MTNRPIKKIALAAMLAGGTGLAFAAGSAPTMSVGAGKHVRSSVPASDQINNTAATFLQNGEDYTVPKVFVVQQQATNIDQPPNDLANRGGAVMGAWQVSQTTGGYNAAGGEGGTWIPVTVTYTGGLCVSGWGVNYGTLGTVFTGNGQEVADRRLDKACPPGSGNVPP